MKKTDFFVSDIPSEAQESQMGLFAVKLENNNVAVLYSDGIAFIVSLYDYVEAERAGEIVNMQSLAIRIKNPNLFLTSRAQIANYLNTARVPAFVLKLRSAAPLMGTDSLANDTEMYRFTAARNDICFSITTSELRKGTYLTTVLDLKHANTGYGAVGRYSLPCPYPGRYLQRYLLPKDTKFHVGTVEPQFNQSGGGVEIKLDSATIVTFVTAIPIDDY